MESVTKRPSILTTLSTIASVTIDTELPVPMETLNMSDYKQGERALPSEHSDEFLTKPFTENRFCAVSL